MNAPLALVYYSNLMPGSRLTNRLQELGYRVQNISQIEQLQQLAKSDKPLVVVAELASGAVALTAIAALRADPDTQHIPVLAFSAEQTKQLQVTALQSGVSLLASSLAILEQLPQLLDQALEVD